MRIVGIESNGPEAGDVHTIGVDTIDVHTIDVWYSARRGAWIVERLAADGGHIGHAHVCADRADAEACLAEWMRAHGETHLVGLHEADLREADLREADLREADLHEANLHEAARQAA